LSTDGPMRLDYSIRHPRGLSWCIDGLNRPALGRDMGVRAVSMGARWQRR